MNPESLVLVGVINRKRDFIAARDEHWYRIPEGRAPRGIHADVLAFFLSGKVFKEQSGAIHYYARRTGVELARRRDLLPDEPNHKRADSRYHKITLTSLEAKIPPVVNEGKYRISFIYTTWDRFLAAQTIRDLYSDADYFVDRVFYALQQSQIKPQRGWEAVADHAPPAEEGLAYPTGASLRVLCESGETVVATTQPFATDEELIYLNPDDYRQHGDASIQAVTERIRQEVQRRGGPKMVDLPIEL